MKKLAKTFVLSAAAAATVLVPMSAANAGDRGWRYDRRPVVVERHHGGDAVALGVLGLAAGAIIGGAIADSRANTRVYVEPPRPTYYPPAPSYNYQPAPSYHYQPAPHYSRPVVYGGAEPWSPGWYDYCQTRYRSFDPSTGTYIGYDGGEHFCITN